MKSNTKQFPKNKIAWLWENMEGKRALYFVGILGTVLYNILQLTIPYFSGKIVDLFLTGENAATNLQVCSPFSLGFGRGLSYHQLNVGHIESPAVKLLHKPQLPENL